MKSSNIIRFLALAVLSQLFHASGQGTAFTYQGRLNDNGSPANGIYDLQFAIYAVPSAGSPLAGPVTNSALAVSNGLFTATLDFGNGVFTGPARWLDIAVRTNGGASFTNLAPRQALLATPYSIFAGTASNVASGSVVKSLNSLKDNVTLAAGANVTLTPAGNTITIGSAGAGGSGIWSLNGTSTYYNGGMVGIGNANPDTMLTIGSSSVRGIMDIYSSSSSVATLNLADQRPGGHTYSFYGGVSGAGNLDIFDQNAARTDLTITSAGNVGVGTSTPASALEVHGDIKLGGTGQYYASGSEENLRIIRGHVQADGTPTTGCCYSVSKCGTGCYTITYDQPFAGIPSVTTGGEFEVGFSGLGPGSTPTASAIRILVFFQDNPSDGAFDFIAIGPR